jgi:MFS family permease
VSSAAEPRPRIRDSVRAFPRATWILFAGTFVHRLASFVFPFLALYLTRRGLTVGQAGLALTGYGLGGVAAQLAGGLLTDRIGRRNAIALSMIASAILVLTVLQARSTIAVVAVVIPYAFFAELHRPASYALLADLTPPEHRLAAIALYRLLVNLAFAIGLAVGGILAARSFTLLFVIDAASSAVFGVISLLVLPHGTKTSKSEERALGGGARAAILADTGFLRVLAAIFASALVYAQTYSTFPLWVRDLGFDEQVYGFLQATNGFLIVAFELAVTAIALRHTRTRMIALGVLLTGLGFGSFAVLTSATGMFMAVVVWSFGEMFDSPSAAAFTADRAPLHARGRYQSALGITYGLAFTLGPLLGTALYRVSPEGVWGACVVLGAIGALLALRAERDLTPGAEGRID